MCVVWCDGAVLCSVQVWRMIIHRELSVCASLGATLSLYIYPSVCQSVMIQMCVHRSFTHDWQSNTWKLISFSPLLILLQVTTEKTKNIRQERIFKEKNKEAFFWFFGWESECPSLLRKIFYSFYFVLILISLVLLLSPPFACLLPTLSHKLLNLVFCFDRRLCGREIFFPSCDTGCGGRD